MEKNNALTVTNNALTEQEFQTSYKDLALFVKNQLKEAKPLTYGGLSGGDYGIIPGTNKKSLLKPGAEKLLKLFGFSAKTTLIKEIENFDQNFVFYKYRCEIIHIKSGAYVADAIRSCNNREKKHMKKNVYDVANTVDSIAQKRALIAATVQATMATEIFDADVSENDEISPDKSVSKKEDPRRAGIISALYAVATDRGWTNAWIHTAIKKRYKCDSLTECSNNEIQELKELIMVNYKIVGKGNKPEKVTSESSEKSAESVEETEEVEEGEVIDETSCAVCHKPVPENSEFDYFCSKECSDEYWGKNKPTKETSKERFNTFLRERAKNKK